MDFLQVLYGFELQNNLVINSYVSNIVSYNFPFVMDVYGDLVCRV
jgi:hypothetical protein